MTVFIERTGKGARAYPCKRLEPKQLGVLGHELATDLVGALAKKPAAAADLAKALGHQEQKVYYHLRKLSAAGLVEVIGSERRHGLMASIYAPTASHVAARLFEGEGAEVQDATVDPAVRAFLAPFVEKGKLNATIVVGSPTPHGPYGKAAYDSAYALDLAAFLGALAPGMPVPCYRFDTELREADLKGNLILVGSPLVNTVTGQLNGHFPVQFTEQHLLRSQRTGRVHNDNSAGLVAKLRNPFHGGSWVLVLAGRRSAGTISAIRAVTRHLPELKYVPHEELVRVVVGKDRDSDGRIDHVQVVE